ncbi:DNA polymerase subunit gamma-1-like [Strongylocentrotus purpuratus]|uniref:DNA polymerase subunit gamma-1 n=1 Tax=Strongylocentrotus purpuratus TaxID=7668 RepID=A0A7M7N8W9_STRPU|nr:DNA polymerase subunit gamma-1-like [Strongylocentrotus purpuratus]
MFGVGKGCRKSVVHLCSYCRLIHGRPLYPSARFRKTLPWQHESTTSSSPFSTSDQNHLSKDDSSVGKPEESHSSSSVSVDSTLDTSPQLRMNAINIQMLSKNLHQRIFNRKASSRSKVKQATETKNDELLEKTKEHLENHRLWGKEGSILPDVDFKLPRLFGSSIDEHFQILANKQSASYLDMAHELAETLPPPMPEDWVFKEGWMKYVENESPVPVDFPEDQSLVFDMECCMAEGNFPTLAVAVSTNAWYSWCSHRLIEDHLTLSQKLALPDLIPLETKKGSTKPPNKKWTERLIVGHNVSFDRSFVKEQYLLQGTKTRFLDTLSLHMCVSGQTTLQRALWQVNARGGGATAAPWIQKKHNKKSFGAPATAWLAESSPNNLADVYSLYSDDGSTLDKTKRDTFVHGSMADIRADFQSLMTYCAQDVAATHKVISKLLPMFSDRFPHPVTFAAMLEMGQAYLPINQNWERYLRDAQETFDNLQQEMKQSLMHIANDACNMHHQDKYREDPWLWELDWSVDDYRLRKTIPLSERAKKKKKDEECSKEKVESEEEENEEVKEETCVEDVLSTAARIPKVNQHMTGYPVWFRELCPKKSHVDWSPGPSLISSQTRITPKLLRLTWDGYPLHYTIKHGWGYLVPGKPDSRYQQRTEPGPSFPLKSLQDMMSSRQEKQSSTQSDDVPSDSRTNESSAKVISTKTSRSAPSHSGRLPVKDVNIPGCWFYKLPHKDGADSNVGNPLAKDFLNKVEDGTLGSGGGAQANRILEINKFISFWRNAQKRISSQMVVHLEGGDLPLSVRRNPDYDEDGFYGAIIPRVITAGTVTRRAVEPTWLTASNARTDRVGSELKSMIQCPPGYHFVGADVDSQELWIAALVGDKNFAGFHGCTAFSWMMLQGKKNEGTDMHSMTASTVGISRDDAKVINYGRIYGAGEKFAMRLLIQFNHRLTQDEARQKARDIYIATKGRRLYRLSATGQSLAEQLDLDAEESDGWVTLEELKILSKKAQIKEPIYSSPQNIEITDGRKWEGGSESAMFNGLEDIAQSENPRTPVLQCSISRALQPDTVNNEFLTSRVNWVVQSSAVDYLHLMLVCMRWLFEMYNIDGRFCISIHDEVRYLVKSEDRYRAALALQITNLLTRAVFAYNMGMNDLPQSVAFFSAVDIDTVLRKEVTMDCQTPSNPHGLHRGYGIPKGEALDIYEILNLTKNGSLTRTASPSNKNQESRSNGRPQAVEAVG